MRDIHYYAELHAPSNNTVTHGTRFSYWYTAHLYFDDMPSADDVKTVGR